MVIFGVEPGGRDSYKIWEEGEIPRVIFEMTSPSTRDQDEGFKKGLYEQLAVEEYWQFDPKGEWIEEQLRGFRWLKGSYEPIADRISTALGLRLEVSDRLIAFYRLDTSEKLLIPEEVRDLWQAAEQRADQEHQRAERLAAQLRAAGIEPENGGA
jgi:Uma2 family endonuclease